MARLVPSRTLPLSGASAPGEQVDQRVLPLPFGPMIPIRSPRRMRTEKSADDRALVVATCRSDQPRSPARPTARPTQRQVQPSRPPRGSWARRPQGLQGIHPSDVALAPGGDPVAQPMLHADDLPIELVLFALFLRQQSSRQLSKAANLRSIRRVSPRSSQIELRDRLARKRRSWLIITIAARRLESSLLQPFDRGKIEAIGRLVEQQDVGSGARTRASAARRASPPESRAGSSSPPSPSCSSR